MKPLKYVANASCPDMPVLKGQGFFIESGKIHEYHPDETDPWRYFWLIIQGNSSAVSYCLAEAGISTQNHVFDIAFFPELLALIKELAVKGISIISSAKALSLFYSLMDLHRSHGKRNTTLPEAHIQDAMLFMENNYHTAIKITDVAHHICVDDQYLYNLFVKRFSISPKQYLDKLRIKKACRLLTETQLSVSEIGDSVGYSDSLAFSAFFKRHTGASPSLYRRERLK